MTTPLATNIDTTYADNAGDASQKQHQIDHDTLHAFYNAKRINNILPETYGAVGNARTVTDAGITSGAATLTSATAVFTSSDVGRRVLVVGAGSGGGAGGFLSTTVSAFTNATTVTLAANATATVSNARMWIGTDDTTALQNCLNALKSGDRMYLDPNKTYLHTVRLNVDVANTGISGHGALVRTDQNEGGVMVRAANVTIEDIRVRCPANIRQGLYEGAGVSFWNVDGGILNRVEIDGSGVGGILWYGATNFHCEDTVVQYSMADGFHCTAAARDGEVHRPIARYVGDDGMAVVSYESVTGNLGLCRDIKVFSPRCLGESGGRGVAIVGGEDILYTDVYVERSAGPGIYLACERGPTYFTYACKRVSVLGAQLYQCFMNAGQSNGVLMVYIGGSGTNATGFVMEDVRAEAIRIKDTRQDAYTQIRVLADSGVGGQHRRINISQVDVEGGPGRLIENAANPTTAVNFIGIVQDGKKRTDVINWGGFAASAWPDGSGQNAPPVRFASAFIGAATVGQTPTVNGEWLTPLHTARSTRQFTSTDSGKVFFVPVMQCRRYSDTGGGEYLLGEYFSDAGVSVAIAQSGGTVATRMGLYASDDWCSRPIGSPLYQFGATTVLTTLGERLATVALRVRPGFYWLAFGYQETAAPSTRATLTGMTGSLWVSGTTLGAPGAGVTTAGQAWAQTGFVATSNLPAVGTLIREPIAPLLGLKKN